MSLNTAGLTLSANAIRAGATHLALHTADPGTTGTNQATSGRVTAGWVGTGTNVGTTGKNFTGGAPSGPVTHVGLWSAGTGGTFYGAYALDPEGDLSFNAAGEYTLDSLNITQANGQ